MLNRLRQWLTPKPLRIARDKRRLEMLLAAAGLSRKARMRIISDYFIDKTDQK